MQSNTHKYWFKSGVLKFSSRKATHKILKFHRDCNIAVYVFKQFHSSKYIFDMYPPSPGCIQHPSVLALKSVSSENQHDVQLKCLSILTILTLIIKYFYFLLFSSTTLPNTLSLSHEPDVAHRSLFPTHFQHLVSTWQLESCLEGLK